MKPKNVKWLERLIMAAIVIVCILYLLLNGCAPRQTTKPEQIQAWCQEAYDIHRAYTENPLYCNRRVGTVEHHRKWCERYDLMIRHFEQEAFKQRKEP